MDKDFNVKGEFPDGEKIKCKDCVFRDKTEVKVNGKLLNPGVTKAYCEMYQGPPKDNGKPNNILFDNEDCDFYVKE